jgi:excisionase family DNA binding protein
MKYEPMLYNRQQAARMLNVSTLTIDRAVKHGNLKANRVGRRVLFSKGSLETFVTRRVQVLQ